MTNKKLKSEIMPTDGTAKKIIQKKDRWENFRSKYLNDIFKESDDIVFVPEKNSTIDYNIPDVYSKCIWLSRDKGSNIVRIWFKKPKLITPKKKKNIKILPYFAMTNKLLEVSGWGVDYEMVVILFGVSLKEGQLIGPIYISSKIIKNKGNKK